MENQASMLSKEGDECLDLPPGFRFHPTDEEIITHYLSHKVLNSKFRAVAIGETDFNKYEPWDLPLKAKMGEKEWYFFFQRDRKYPTGLRTNRATEAGYWKATGKDKEIYKGKSCLVGMKKTLVFYRGRAPKGEKTNWVMHEFRLEGKFSYHNIPRTAKDEWVVCRVFHKSSSIKKSPISGMLRMNSFVDGLIDSPTLPSLMDSHYLNRPGPSFFADQEEEIFKGTASTTSLLKASDGLIQMPYFSMEDHQHDQKTYLPNNLQRNPYDNHPLQNSFMYSQKNPSLGSSVNLGYLHQVRNESEFGELRKLCKMEQFSNQSMVSQDTGLSTDRTTEISSMVSKQDQMGSYSRSYEDLEDPSSGAALDSLESLWSY